MPSLNELISKLPSDKIYEFQTRLLCNLNDRKWCVSKGLDYNNLPSKDVQKAKWETYNEIISQQS